MRRRKPKRRGIGRVSRKDSYLIMILLCLILLNLGALAIRVVMENKQSDSTFIREIVRSVDVFGWAKEVEVIEEPIVQESIIDEEDELQTSKDFIIDRLDEYESLIIIKDNTGLNRVDNIPGPLNINKLSVNKEDKYILMYHTHATESYLVEDGETYYNEDITKNVVSVGDIMSKVLEANGHKVDHVQTLHDLPAFNKAYAKSLNTIKNKKEENGNLKIFLDIHRDGVENDAAYKERFLETARIQINGVSTATFSLVLGPDTPNYDQVLSFAKYIKAVSDSLYPGLCTGIIVKPIGKYNLYSSDYAALLEVGSNFVTQEEAIETAKIVGEILSLVFDSIIE